MPALVPGQAPVQNQSRRLREIQFHLRQLHATAFGLPQPVADTSGLADCEDDEQSAAQRFADVERVLQVRDARIRQLEAAVIASQSRASGLEEALECVRKTLLEKSLALQSLIEGRMDEVQMMERVKNLVASLPNTVQAEHVRTRQLSPPIASCGSMFTAAVRGSCPGNSCSGSRSTIPVTTLRCSVEPTQCFSSRGGGSCTVVARPATPETPRPAVMRGFSAVLARSATPETPRRLVVRTFCAASAPRTSQVFGGSCSTASSVRIVPPAVVATTAHGAQVRVGGTPSWPGPAAARPSLGWQSVVVCPVEEDVQEALLRPRWRPP